MTQNVIITHDGRFHADEVLACVLLKRINPIATIIRTRDNDVLNLYLKKNQVIAVVDVFGIYNPDERRFDHHQREFNVQIGGVKCSSAGLIFKHYSKDILRAYNITTKYEDRLIKEIYLKYFRVVDAIDNGIDISCKIKLSNDCNSVERDLGLRLENYNGHEEQVYMRTISSIVACCRSFEEAFFIVNMDFNNFMCKTEKWINSYERVLESLTNIEINGYMVDARFRKQILLTENLSNVGNLVCEIEKELGMNVLYYIDEQDGTFKVYAVPESANAFKTKKPLNEKWRGLRDRDLQRVSGIDGCIFVHATGFLGVNKTLQGALQMCYGSI